MATKTGKKEQPIWLGGAAASMAVLFTHPLDQTKYRMQVLQTRTPLFTTLRTFAVRDGLPSLWSGISASILRQSTYSTARFGLYNLFARQLQQASGQTRLSSTSTIACAGLAGGLAGVIGNPAEVVLVRMCADGAKPLDARFRYSNAGTGLYRIWREEGLTVFGRGMSANIVRSVLMNVGQIATYATAKRQILAHTNLKDNDIRTHAIASLLAGTVATTVCTPADVLKSRIQSTSGRGSISAIVAKGLREEGPLFLMKGWTPAWLRLAPNTVLTFVFMERLGDLWRRYHV